MKPIARNTLFYGDNLNILREYVPDSSIDLIYLDPPFNSNRNYNVLFKDEGGIDSQAQITAFEDTWHWDRSAEDTYHELVINSPPRISKMIGALREFIGANQMMAYLVMMTARMIELHRVLKDTGSLYLHCDPTASHYLKIVLDTVFGVQNFRNEIIWKRTTAHSDSMRWGSVHDIIFFYTKTDNYIWNNVYMPYDGEYSKRFSRTDPDGRQWTDDNLTAKGLSGGGYTYEYKGTTSLWRVPLETMERLDAQGRLYFTKNGGIRLKRYLDEMPGTPIQDVIADIFPVNSQARERIGYPTQKPIALLERIIAASSKEGDWVLDPFAGCGTTIAAAEKLGRKWIGIDITHLAVSLLKYRLRDMRQETEAVKNGKNYEVVGEPADFAGAQRLAKDDPYQFQWWACGLIAAKPVGGESGSRKGKKGADRGIDGIITFIDDDTKKPKRVLVQVKSGETGSRDIRDLVGTVDREKAAMGVFITLHDSTKHMDREAFSAGHYRSEGWNRDYPRIQILTINDLLSGASVNMPPVHITFKQAPKEKKNGHEQAGFLDVMAKHSIAG